MIDEDLGFITADLFEERKRQIARVDEARAAMQDALRTLRLDSLMASVVAECGDHAVYRYPNHEELGLSVETLASDEPSSKEEVLKKIESANEESRARNGQIALLLETYRLSNDDADKVRSELRGHARTIVEARLRVLQIDDLRLILLSSDPSPGTTAADVAKMFCGTAGESSGRPIL